MVIMSIEELKELKLNDLKQLAKEREIKVTGLKKEEIIELLADKQEEKEEVITEVKGENSEIRFIGKKNPDPSVSIRGILTVMEDGYGFIRGENFETGDDNVFCPNPECGCLMKLHGRCRRYVRRPDGLRDELSLRVLYCPNCHQYHR